MNPSITADFKHPRPINLSIWWIVGSLLLLVVGLGIAIFNGFTPAKPQSTEVWSRALHFADAPNGDVVVIDHKTNQEITRLQGEQGFIRGTLRALSRERHLRKLGPSEPFELVNYADGRLEIRDASTNQRIELQAFGPTNLASFVQLMKPL